MKFKTLNWIQLKPIRLSMNISAVTEKLILIFLV